MFQTSRNIVCHDSRVWGNSKPSFLAPETVLFVRASPISILIFVLRSLDPHKNISDPAVNNISITFSRQTVNVNSPGYLTTLEEERGVGGSRLGLVRSFLGQDSCATNHESSIIEHQASRIIHPSPSYHQPSRDGLWWGRVCRSTNPLLQSPASSYGSGSLCLKWM